MNAKQLHQFSIEPCNWENQDDGHAAADHAHSALDALPEAERKKAWEDGMLYLDTDGESGSMDALDAIADAAIAKATADYDSQPQSGHGLSVYPV